MSPEGHDSSVLSSERHASLEVRIRQRVLDRCVAEAKTALAESRFADAEASLAEASALDAEQPDVRALSAELTEQHRQPPEQRAQPTEPRPQLLDLQLQPPDLRPQLPELLLRPIERAPEPTVRQSRTRWWPVAAVMLASVAILTFIERRDLRLSSPDQLQPAAGPRPDVVNQSTSDAPVELPPADAPRDQPSAELSAPASPPTPLEEAVRSDDVEEAVPTAASPLEPSRSETARTTDVVTPRPETVRPANESLLVDRALQRYREGYDRLDAEIVQSVYPTVDPSPLARAFEELASQSLVFDACDIDVRGAVANATCRGTARYVPRIGSAEPRVEPRVWTFTLRRGADNWIIERAWQR